MHDLPHAEDLLITARDSLLNELLPHLPEAQKYTALMVANAMLIVSREHSLSSDADYARKALQRQAQAYCSRVEDITDDKALCTALRNGDMDVCLIELLPVLRADVLCRLRVGNPKYLQQVQTFTESGKEGQQCPN
jgi:hypothetical protein